MSTHPFTLHRARVLNPVDAETFVFFDDAALVVSAEGTIVDFGFYSEINAKYSLPPAHCSLLTCDFRPYLLLPGLVDVHSHLPQYEAVAMEGEELLPWLQKYIFPAEARFGDAELARERARRFFSDLLAHGTTTAVAYCTVHQEATDIAFAQAEKAGIRAVLGKVMMDQNSPPALVEATERSLRESEELCQQWHGRDGDRLQYAFSPRFAPTCSMRLMQRAASLAHEYGAYVQTHLSENLDELTWVRQLFPDCAHYSDVYYCAGLLGERTLVAHCVYLSEAEYDLLEKTGTRICHCPSANFFLKSGVMDLARAVERGIHVGLGTDVGAGPSLSLFREMGAACLASKARWAMERFHRARLSELWAQFSMLGERGAQLFREVMERLELDDTTQVADPTLAFYLATLGGARALGMERRVGSFAVGKEADFVVIDTAEIDPARNHQERAPEEILSQLVYRGKGAMIKATYVRGRLCYAEGG